jgi:GT2 family glycosyltransferase
MNRISVIIPNYNGRKFLKDCLDSIFASTLKPQEVIIIDNASADDSIEIISNYFPKVKVIKLKENLGFAKAVNLGLKKATGDYFFILNNDAFPGKNCLRELMEVMSSRPEVDFCATKMVWLKNPQIIDSAGIAYSWKGKGYNFGHGKKDGWEFSKQKFVFGASNGAAFYRCTLFDRVGYLDENFSLVGDDIDFSFRANLLGAKCLYVPKAVVRHAGGGTVGDWTKMKAIFSARHHLYIIIKNFPIKFIIFNFPQILIERLRNLSGLLKSVPWWQALCVILLTYGGIIVKLPEMLKKRRSIQNQRKVSDDYLRSVVRRADFSAD